MSYTFSKHCRGAPRVACPVPTLAIEFRGLQGRWEEWGQNAQVHTADHHEVHTVRKQHRNS